jgi:hypothetical protein
MAATCRRVVSPLPDIRPTLGILSEYDHHYSLGAREMSIETRFGTANHALSRAA